MHKYSVFQNEPPEDPEISILQPQHTDVQLSTSLAVSTRANANPAMSQSNGAKAEITPTTFHGLEGPTTGPHKEINIGFGIPDPSEEPLEFQYSSLRLLASHATYEPLVEEDSHAGPADYGMVKFDKKVVHRILVTKNQRWTYRWFKSVLKIFIEHLIFRIFSMLMVIIDISILIADFSQPDKSAYSAKIYDMVSLCFVCYFVVEVFLRIFVKGLEEFFSQWFNAVDFVVVIIGFVVTVIYTAVESISGYAKLVIVGRLIRVVLFARLYTEHKNLKKGARMVVSENKRRYQKEGFDLDLTYITERVIAMSFPSSGKMSLYRNPIKEVARFFNTKYKDHYKIYNLCKEKGYDTSHFYGRVERFMIDDHNVPPLKELKRFVTSVGEWLNSDPKNIIAVHCKGGKGRTGTMICTWLLEAGMFMNAQSSLDYFASRRTDLNVGSKFQGVETPSQSRYVHYYQEIREKYGGEVPPEVPMQLRHIRINALAGVGKGNGSDMSCEIRNGDDVVLECDFGERRNCQVEYLNEADVLEVTVINCPILCGDVRIRFHCSSRNVPKGYEDCAFYFWFHTSFITDYRFSLPRDQIDNCHKSKTWKVFREKFGVELVFTPPGDQQDIPLN